VVAEHARGATFLIADGVVPSNVGRGYVLRRLIRRAVRYGRKLGLTEPFLGKVADLVVERMGAQYMELGQNREFILRVLELEEQRFAEVYERGLQLLASFSANRNEKQTVARNIGTMQPDLLTGGGSVQAKAQRFNADIVQYRGWPGGEIVELLQHVIENEANRLGATETSLQEIRNRFVQSDWANNITGLETFELHDTYGFPVEVTAEIAKEHGLTVDMAGFEREMEAQRVRARASTRMGGGVKREAFDYAGLGVGGTTFVGYERLEQQSVVLALIVDGQAVQSATEGQEVEAVLRETPFYAEKGGQLGDAGEIAGPFGRVAVTDTQSPVSEIIVHRGRVAQGSIAVGETVRAAVDVARRMDTARNHTATHMLHAALRQVLGAHVRQAGSLVAAERLRFDFSHVQAVTRDELRQVEALVNEKIRQDLPVGFHETTYTKAVQEGALAFFGETYGASVRVVEVGECDPHPNLPPTGGKGHEHPEGEACFSKEVCGGTHLTRTGQIGLCLVLGEQSVGAGMRRIEAVTGRHAETMARERMDTLDGLAQSLAATPAEAPQRVAALREELERAKEHAATLERELLRNEVEQALANPAPGAIHELPLQNAKAVALSLEHAASADALRETADWAKGKLGSAVVALGAVFNGQPTIVVSVTPDLVKAGVHAGRIARELGAAMGGGGGGRPESAQAGGHSTSSGQAAAKLDEALRMLAKLVGGSKPPSP
jgi:alanyl-tRNA synthetase